MVSLLVPAGLLIMDPAGKEQSIQTVRLVPSCDLAEWSGFVCFSGDINVLIY